VNVELARARLKDLTLYSPFAGHLSRWELYVGDTVSPGGPLGTLLDNALFHIDVRIDETEVGDVALGQRVNVLLDAYRDQELTGTVASIALAGENTLGIVTYAVTIEISDSDLPIRPLMTAAVEIVTDVRSDVVLVPNRALRRDAEGTYVELPEFDADENPLRAYLQLGVGNEVETEVQSGLASGQRVIVLRPREAGFGPFGG